jgi:WD40 repeat protein/GTPase SAR1 family protein
LLAVESQNGTIRVWDLASGKVLRTLKGHSSRAQSLAWSPEGQLLASFSADQPVRLWDPASDEPVLTLLGQSSWTQRSVAGSADQRPTPSGSAGGTIVISDRRTGKVYRVMNGQTDSIKSSAYSPGGDRVAFGLADGTIQISNRYTGRVHRVLKGHTDSVISLAWSPDGRRLASGSADTTIRLWGPTAGKVQRVLTGQTAVATRLAWSIDGRWLVSGSADQTIRVWDPASGKAVLSLPEDPNCAQKTLAWSPDGHRLASGSADGTVWLWDLKVGNIKRPLYGHTNSVTSLAWSPDGRELASGSADHTIRLWDWRAGDSKCLLEDHTAPVCAFAWSRDSDFLVSVAMNCEVAFWNVSDRKLVGALERLSYRFLPLALLASGEARGLPDRLGDAEILRRRLSVAPGVPPETRVVSPVATVALVGDAGVGKSCLALRLAEGRFEEQAPTHGLRTWTLPVEGLHPNATPLGQHRELFLWDFAGGENTRLAHEIFLPGITTALVLFDASRGELGYAAVEEWSRRLDLNAGRRKIQKTLVRTKLDLGGTVDRRRLHELLERYSFAGYCEVSASTGEGIDALCKELSAMIAWDDTVGISRVGLYHTIRETLHEERKRAAVLFQSDLEKRLRERRVMVPKREVDAALRHLALRGYLFDIQFVQGGRALLLRPDTVARYASSLIMAARGHPRGVPLIDPQRILSARIPLPGIQDDQRLAGPAERAVFECVVQLFLEHGICLEHAGVLVFPTLFHRAADGERDAMPNSWRVCYDFSGPIDNIYASLVARLAVTGEFGGVRLWASGAEYQQSGKGVFGVRRKDRGRGEGRLEFYFSSDTDPERRSLFIRFVEDDLRSHAVEVRGGLALDCECGGFCFDDFLLRPRLRPDRRDVGCPSCSRRYPLPRFPFESQELVAQLHALKARSKEQTYRIVEQVMAGMELSAKEASGGAPVRILHLSDLHLAGNSALKQLLEPLDADLRGIDVQELDYLVVCGDLADNCDPDGFALAEKFLRELMARFRLSADRLILVPGNHEVDEDQRFGRFRQFYKNLKQADYPERNELQGMVIPYPEDGIEFLTLNSGWETDRSSPVRTGIHAGALSRALSDTNPEMKVRVVVWHHPVTVGNTVAKPEQIRALVKAGYQLCLHGDVHGHGDGFLERLDALGRLRVLGAGSFPSPDSSLCPPGLLLYNLIEVESDFSRIRVRSRAQRSIGAPFESYSLYGTSDDPEMRRGDYRISLMPSPLLKQLEYARTELDRLIHPPEGPIEARGIYIAHRRVDSAVCSADFYSVVPREDGSLGIYLVDVEGHGLAAAIRALTVARLLHRPGFRWGHGRPHEELDTADERIAEEFAEHAVAVTMNFTEIDPKAKKVRFANAGMPPALLFHTDRKEFEVLEAIGMYVGAGYREHAAEPREVETSFESGDTLILCSDGISEARDKNGRVFGQRGVLDTVSRSGVDSPEVVADEILKAVQAHTGSQQPEDDQAVLVIRLGTLRKISATDSVEEFGLLNTRDAVRLCDEEMKPDVLAWAAGHGGRTREGALNLWAGVWEAILNAIQWGSKRGDEIRIRLMAEGDKWLVIEVEQSMPWTDYGRYLNGPIEALDGVRDLSYGGTVIMRRSASHVMVTLGGRCVELRYRPVGAPDQVNA